MKLVIVTAVEEFQKDILNLFKASNIKNFSSSEIGGYKNGSQILIASNWFSSERPSNESIMFFSFTEEEHIDTLITNIKKFNEKLHTNNPVKAVVVPIERYV